MKKNSGEDEGAKWAEVIGRSLAFLCLHYAGFRKDKSSRQAKFLKSLGLENRDIAAVLETSPDAVRALLSQAKKDKRINRARKINETL